MAEQTWIDVWGGVVAKYRGALSHDSGGLLLAERAYATLVVNGVRMRLESRVTGTYPAIGLLSNDVIPPMGGTLVTAPAPGAGRLSLKVKHGHVYPIGRAFGIQDERTGDDAFDDRFVVKTNAPTVALAWLDAPLRAAMLRATEYTYEIRGCAATATLSSIESNSTMLEAALRAVASLAARLPRAIAGWRDLASEIGAKYLGLAPPPRDASAPWWGRALDAKQPSFNGLAIEAEHEGARVMVDVCLGQTSKGKRARKDLYTRARCRRAEGHDKEIRWTAEGGSAAFIDASVRDLFLRAGLVAAFTDGDHVTLMCKGVLSDPAQVRLLIAATARFADAEPRPVSRGPYR